MLEKVPLNTVGFLDLDLRIAILTGYDVPEYREAALKSGAKQFFVKESLKWEEIEALVKSIE